ncbi:hypothetical protein QWZ08_14685 [Ferruginibacter paludis]|uniref:hypothetical protein n=1 Tax=Ferruginibacter paludis TaxID=1310417 RepID=UPI0025B60C04|nr:hypothetical protein [Ferruginibacter paludis]MDN3656891.1 hypothetical protein [Ferruginibacter paludis]
MKQTFNNTVRHWRIAFAVISSLALFSFTIVKMNGEFLKQLGISKTEADQKITGSILGGYLNQYGIRNAKNIAVGNRAAVTKDLLLYTKQFVNSTTFIKEYNTMRENEKPKPYLIETPEAMRSNQINMLKKSVSETEANIKTADASIKKIFEDVLVSTKQQLKEAEDPNNKTFVNYKKNYPDMLKSAEASSKQSLHEWEAKYPTNHLLFVKKRLQDFLTNTADIDFDAALTTKNNKNYFVNPLYEKQKGSYWKMAFRAGKEVVLPAREFVQQWLDEIK